MLIALPLSKVLILERGFALPFVGLGSIETVRPVSPAPLRLAVEPDSSLACVASITSGIGPMATLVSLGRTDPPPKGR